MLVFLSNMKWFIFVGLIGLVLGGSHVGYVSKCFWTSDNVSTMFLLKMASWNWALFWILVWWFSQGHYPWTARISNQSILKEISPEYPLEGLMLKLKLQYFGHLMQRTDSLEKILMLGKTEGRTTEDEMVGWLHQLDGHEFEQVPGVGDGQGSLACCSQWGHKELDTTEWLNWSDRGGDLLRTGTLQGHGETPEQHRRTDFREFSMESWFCTVGGSPCFCKVPTCEEVIFPNNFETGGGGNVQGHLSHDASVSWVKEMDDLVIQGSKKFGLTVEVFKRVGNCCLQFLSTNTTILLQLGVLRDFVEKTSPKGNA